MSKKAGFLQDHPGFEKGEILLSLDERGSTGKVRRVEKVFVKNSTKEKVLALLRQIYSSGFKGNVHIPTDLSDPMVITTEELRRLDGNWVNEIFLVKPGRDK